MTVRNQNETFHTESAADAELILRARSGAGTAFAELWRRHHSSGIAAAQSITSSIDPGELVQESFTRIHQAILKGSGPNGSFRAHLFTTIRNTAAAWGRPSRDTVTEELETVTDPDSAELSSTEALDPALTAQAFRGLPARWQEVLWYADIEQMDAAQAAPLLGMRAGAVSQLASRAREGFREAWLQVQLRSTASDSECHWVIGHIGAHSRGNLSTRDLQRADRHFEDCARCLVVAEAAKDVAGRLAAVLLPLVLGISAAAGYTAMVQARGIPAGATEPMPSSVVAFGGTAAGPRDITAAMTGASATPGGTITGIGALVGAGSAALVVAGVVAAATIVPGLVNASPVTSLPSAGDADGSSISSEVSPDGEVDSEDRFLLELSEDAPEDKKVDTAPKAAPKADGVPPTADAGASDERVEGGDSSEATEPPADTTPPVKPTPEPTVPPGSPKPGTVEQTCTGQEEYSTEYVVPLTGVADTAVRTEIDGVMTGKKTILGTDGTGTVTLTLTDAQIAESSVSFIYVVGDMRGEVVAINLDELYDGEACTISPMPDPDAGTPVPPPSSGPDADDPVVDDSTVTDDAAAANEATVAEDPAPETVSVRATPAETDAAAMAEPETATATVATAPAE